MPQLPDPNAIDWNSVGLWAIGIGTGIGSMVGAAMLAIRKAVKVARDNPTTVTTREETRVVTTDSVAMHELAGEIAALNATVVEVAQILRREIADREMDEEIERRAKMRAEELLEEERRQKSVRRTT